MIVDKVLAGKSVNSVADEHGIDPRTTLHKRLKRVELKGWVTYNDEIVRDDERLPAMRSRSSMPGHGTGCKRSYTPTRRALAYHTMLFCGSAVIFCDECKGTMYRTVVTNSQGRSTPTIAMNAVSRSITGRASGPTT